MKPCGTAAWHAALDHYPTRGVSLLGREVHWMIVYFGLVTVFVLALARRVGVVL